MTGVALLDQHLLSVLIALPLIGARCSCSSRGRGRRDPDVHAPRHDRGVPPFPAGGGALRRRRGGMQLVERVPGSRIRDLLHRRVDGISLWI